MQRLNLRHLGYFRAVAHAGGLTRAAGLLGVSQSALSLQIRTLEERIGHALFERVGRSLRLTEAGRIALDRADAIHATAEDLVAALGGAGAGHAALRVGALATCRATSSSPSCGRCWDGRGCVCRCVRAARLNCSPNCGRSISTSCCSTVRRRPDQGLLWSRTASRASASSSSARRAVSLGPAAISPICCAAIP
jgi:hypothetical protein